MAALLLATAALTAVSRGTSAGTAPPAAAPDSIYQFTDLVAIDGAPLSLAAFAGNVTLVVNVASY